MRAVLSNCEHDFFYKDYAGGTARAINIFAEARIKAETKN